MTGLRFGGELRRASACDGGRGAGASFAAAATLLLLLAACGGGEAPVPVTVPEATKPADQPLRGMRVIRPEAVDSAVAPVMVAAADPNILFVDDFNDGEKPNLIGGNFGGWNRDPLDETQGCLEEFSLENHGVGSGISVKLTYDVESPNPAFNGFWMRLNELDVSQYRELVFHIRGDQQAGFTTRLKVELKNNVRGERAGVIIDGITTGWTRFRIPLNQFFQISDWTKVSEFVIVFDDELATKKTGAIYLDDVYFVK